MYRQNTLPSTAVNRQCLDDIFLFVHARFWNSFAFNDKTIKSKATCAWCAAFTGEYEPILIRTLESLGQEHEKFQQSDAELSQLLTYCLVMFQTLKISSVKRLKKVLTVGTVSQTLHIQTFKTFKLLKASNQKIQNV